MIDHLVGRPSPSWKRVQVFLVILFWLWRILRGASGPPRILGLRRLNAALRRFSPWQIIVSTLTAVYAMRNFDKILGLDSPEPLSRLYSPSYYRATWIATGLDAGFATAMSIRPKWLRDLCSIVFALYYIVYANEGDEKLRRFRAVPTVEMLRTTWEKTSNPYIRLVTHLPQVNIRQKLLLPRPKSSNYTRPITTYLFFSQAPAQLRQATDLILDFPGGGFVAMSPEHHEERLRMWAVNTKKPVLSVDYGKAPEYPYPYAIHEAFDAYKALVESVGVIIGMSGKRLRIILSGDSAGSALAVNVVMSVLEYNTLHPNHPLPLPVAVVLNYAALDFNFTSWMTPENLRVLRSEQSSGNIPGMKQLVEQKDHLKHISPLSMVGDKRGAVPHRKRPKRRSSWKETFRGFTSGGETEENSSSSTRPAHRRTKSGLRTPTTKGVFLRPRSSTDGARESDASDSSTEEEVDFNQWREEDRPIKARVRYVYPSPTTPGGRKPLPLTGSTLERQQKELYAALSEAESQAVAKGKIRQGNEPVGTRLTMTSRTGYFQDRIISPSMMRAMAILYIGPHLNPDFATDYRLSPILAPSHLLAKFPPLLMQCGEKDPFVDDTVIFAGRVREAKRARKVELDLAISGKSARFGETLRMSQMEVQPESASLASLTREREKLAQETDDDWVQLVIFSEWSHGYLQMPTLMAEAKAVIDELGGWIDDAFVRYGDKGSSPGAQPERPGSPFTSGTETDDSGITFVPKKYHSRTTSRSIGEEVEEKSEYGGRATPVGDEEGKGGRQGGQTISEGELMRRRRLLDSHIFD